MRHVVLVGALLVAGATALACGDSNTAVLASSGGTSGSNPIILDDGGTTSDNLDGGAGTGTATGLPCDVQKVLEDGCIACHGGAQAPRLLTLTDLTAQSSQYPGQTVAQRALTRMQAGTMPPAPAVPPTAPEIATFQTWVQAGLTQGTVCTTPPPAATDAGTTNTPPVCTSNKQGSTGDGPGMDPGRACLACHQQRGGPRFTVGGTVYPTAHEPDQCIGIGSLNVVITDSKGTVTTLPVQASGNFCSSTKCGAPAGVSIVPPFHAQIVNPATGAKRAMGGTITAGDCNGCHTQNGANGAPGRIMAP